jgi:oligosaccharide repeat unit polymerase
MRQNYLWPKRNRSFLAIALFAFLITAFCSFMFLAPDKSVQLAGMKVAVALAAIMLLLGIWVIYARIRKSGTVIDGYVLIWAAFIVVYPLSALVHLITPNIRMRGFYDLILTDYSSNIGTIYYSLGLVLISFIALWLGLRSKSLHTWTTTTKLKVPTTVLLVLAILFISLGIFGTLKLFEQVPSLFRALSTVDRMREIGGGLARYVFMSHWFSWGLIFLTMYLLKTFFIRSRFTTSCLMILFALLILANIFWTGSRGSAVVSVLPGMVLLRRIRPNYTKFILIFVGILLISYFILTTLQRSVGAGTLSYDEMLIDIFDWQVGRFSMIGLGIKIANSQGYAWGSTLYDGLVNAINTPLTLLNLPLIVQPPQSITSVVGEYLVGNPLVTGIVPGTTCELYYNFGLVGVAVGYFLIGKILHKCIQVIQETRSMGFFAIAAYCLILICTSFFPGTFTSWIYYLITIGFPVICLCFCELLFKVMVNYDHKYRPFK